MRSRLHGTSGTVDQPAFLSRLLCDSCTNTAGWENGEQPGPFFLPIILFDPPLPFEEKIESS